MARVTWRKDLQKGGVEQRVPGLPQNEMAERFSLNRFWFSLGQNGNGEEMEGP